MKYMYIIEIITLCKNWDRNLTLKFSEKILIITIEGLLIFNTGPESGPKYFINLKRLSV